MTPLRTLAALMAWFRAVPLLCHVKHSWRTIATGMLESEGYVTDMCDRCGEYRTRYSKRADHRIRIIT